jgi:Family of unknown function (DUF6364)
LEKTVIEEAKSYAKKTGRSLSELVANCFKNLTKKSEIPNDIPLKVKKLIGIIKLPDDFDEEKVKEV